MANKQIHRVSPELTNDAQFKSIESIPTTILSDGDTILVYPGEYTDPRTANIGNVTVEGFGHGDNVVFTGFSVLSDMPASSTIDIKNIRVLAPGVIVGNSAVTVNIADCTIDGTTGTNRAAALTVANAAVLTGVLDSNAAVAATDAASTVVLTRCMIGQNEGHGYGVVSHNNSGSVVMRNCHVASDAGLLTNVAAAIEHCTFTGANNYASSVAAGGAGVPTVTVRASVAAAANAGNMTETIVALIS
jgi:hypothetical protein